MPKLVDSDNCCGCAACANKCAKHAITMLPNEEGFLYPWIDETLCVECRVCEDACPALCYNRNSKITPPRKIGGDLWKAFIVQHNDDVVRYQSTSGGAFTAIAEGIIKKGGVVFGVIMTDELKVVHTYVESKDDLAQFRNSKYVQSEIKDCYKLAKVFLSNGRYVCFSGTPCQISGLKRFLGKEYENLLTVDLVCKSVPSPLVFDKYIEFKKQKEKHITDVVFRDKKRGFLYCTMAHYSSHKARTNGNSVYRRGSESDEWLRLFLSGRISRLSCVTCPYQAMKHASDITLGDIWETGVSDFDDDKGTTKVYVWTNKGLSLLAEIKDTVHCMEVAIKPSKNSTAYNRFRIYPNRKQLFQDVKDLSATEFFKRYAPYNTKVKVKNLFRFLLWKIGMQSFVRHIKHSIIHRNH